jgi:hypothetical protein
LGAAPLDGIEGTHRLVQPNDAHLRIVGRQEGGHLLTFALKTRLPDAYNAIENTRKVYMYIYIYVYIYISIYYMYMCIYVCMHSNHLSLIFFFSLSLSPPPLLTHIFSVLISSPGFLSLYSSPLFLSFQDDSDALKYDEPKFKVLMDGTRLVHDPRVVLEV